MLRALAFVALVGCYNPTIPSGTACETTCPGDLVCVEHICREPGYVAADAAIEEMIDARAIDAQPGDSDGDGLLDANDNCPARANADQHDEDGDQLGDVCDPCPHLAGTAADLDGDGVGDACDPQPALAKQQIVFFDPFTSDRPEWNPGPGTTRVGETLRIQSSAGSFAISRLVVATGELRIVTGGTITSIDAATPHSLVIAYGFNGPNGDSYYYDEFYDDGTGTGSLGVTKADQGTYTRVVFSDYNGTLPTGAWSMRIDESVANQRVDLLATLGGVQRLPLTGTTSSPPLAVSTSSTFLVRNADVRFNYVLVIRTMP